MPNLKSAKKRVDVAERNRLKNVAVKSSIKTAVKKVLEAVSAKNQETIKSSLSFAYKLLDKAAGKKIMHKNTVARKKSRLTSFINKNQG